MNPSFQKLNLLLGKLQASMGTKQTGLTLTDQRAIEDNFALEYVPEFSAQNLAQGIFGQPQPVKGTAPVSVKISMPIVPSGGVTKPNVSDLLQCAGMSKSGPSTNAFTYAPSSVVGTDWNDMTLWGYTGDKTTGNSLLTKAHSTMFNAKFSGDLGKPFIAAFDGKGVPDGFPAAASYNAAGAITLLSTVTPAVIKSTTATIGGITGLHILKFECDLGNVVELIKSPSDDSGFIRSIITNRASKWQATVLQDAVGTNNPVSVMDAQTLSNLDFVFGTAGSRIEVKSNTSKCQITSIKQGNDAGLNTFELSGIFVDNDWQLIIGVA
jgi:hypothetical protein